MQFISKLHHTYSLYIQFYLLRGIIEINLKKKGGGASETGIWLWTKRNMTVYYKSQIFLFERGRHNHIGAPTDLKLKWTEEIRIEKWLIAFVLRHLRCTTRFDSFWKMLVALKRAVVCGVLWDPLFTWLLSVSFWAGEQPGCLAEHLLVRW